MRNVSPYVRDAAKRAGIHLVPIGIERGAVMHVAHGKQEPWPGHAEDVLWVERGGQPTVTLSAAWPVRLMLVVAAGFLIYCLAVW